MTAAQNSDIVTRLNRILSGADERGLDETECRAIRDAADEIEQLRQERDEARWEVCGFHHLTGFLAGDYAISRGWSYFNDKRKWPGFPPSVSDFDRFLKAQDQILLDVIDRVTKERDEARRQVCVTLYTNKEMQRNHARLCGWDCFKENCSNE